MAPRAKKSGALGLRRGRGGRKETREKDRNLARPSARGMKRLDGLAKRLRAKMVRNSG